MTDTKQGEQNIAQGVQGNTVRVGSQNELIVAEAHARFYEACKNGRLQFSHVTAQTLVAANTTYTGHLLHNPLSSGVNAVIHKIGLGVSVTSASMTGIAAGYSAQAAAPTGLTAATNAGNCKLGAAAGAVQSYKAATIAAAGSAFMHLMHNTAAINTVGMDGFGIIDLEGSIIVPPGYTFHLLAEGAASAASAVTSSILWEEAPI